MVHTVCIYFNIQLSLQIRFKQDWSTVIELFHSLINILCTAVIATLSRYDKPCYKEVRLYVTHNSHSIVRPEWGALIYWALNLICVLHTGVMMNAIVCYTVEVIFLFGKIQYDTIERQIMANSGGKQDYEWVRYVMFLWVIWRKIKFGITRTKQGNHMVSWFQFNITASFNILYRHLVALVLNATIQWWMLPTTI